SNQTKGSILGDKTRMSTLSRLPEVFIRPTPTSGTLGGVAAKTRETILLFEAAGYDVILIETVGVGQSETAVRKLSDIFLLLLLSGAGDELQGIKKGIMEVADMFAINKADGDLKHLAREAAQDLKRALQLYPEPASGVKPSVDTCSALTGEGMDQIWQKLKAFHEQITANDFLSKQRKEQSRFWMHEMIHHELRSIFYN
ncbi:MAG: methylmalonyl Co-A mutase-associated GTPase MeaB, partial [bacterium]|nr:methylmalonyl Co-A mutase-associated GTPase MeaB [bacterium]